MAGDCLIVKLSLLYGLLVFALLGFYLLGKIKFPHDDDDNKVGVTRFFMALVSLAFAVYMVPGLSGSTVESCQCVCSAYADAGFQFV